MMGNQHGASQQPRHGARPTDKDPRPSEGQDEKDLGEDEGKDKNGAAADALDPQGHQATPGIDVSIEK